MSSDCALSLSQMASAISVSRASTKWRLFLLVSPRNLMASPLIAALIVSGYHADTPITMKAEAIHEADSRIH